MGKRISGTERGLQKFVDRQTAQAIYEIRLATTAKPEHFELRRDRAVNLTRIAARGALRLLEVRDLS